jgi:hypothetical protein
LHNRTPAGHRVPPARAHSRARGPDWLRFGRFAAGRQAPARNWVRFARSDPELGSFCTFHSPAEPRPTRHLPLPTYSISPKFGFVLHNFLRQPPRRDEIGFVLHASALRGACPRPDRGLPRHAVLLRGRPARLLPPRPEIGFVLRIHPPAGPNWVRFAHSASAWLKPTLSRWQRPRGTLPLVGARSALLFVVTP